MGALWLYIFLVSTYSLILVVTVCYYFCVSEKPLFMYVVRKSVTVWSNGLHWGWPL
jgi:hypothetical protein